MSTNTQTPALSFPVQKVKMITFSCANQDDLEYLDSTSDFEFLTDLANLSDTIGIKIESVDGVPFKIA